MYRKDYAEHLNNCPKRMVPCSDCRTRMPFDALGLHESVCDEKIVPCPITPELCKTGIKRGGLGIHPHICIYVICRLQCGAVILRSEESKHFRDFELFEKHATGVESAAKNVNLYKGNVRSMLIATTLIASQTTTTTAAPETKHSGQWLSTYGSSVDKTTDCFWHVCRHKINFYIDVKDDYGTWKIGRIYAREGATYLVVCPGFTPYTHENGSYMRIHEDVAKKRMAPLGTTVKIREYLPGGCWYDIIRNERMHSDVSSNDRLLIGWLLQTDGKIPELGQWTCCAAIFKNACCST